MNLEIEFYKKNGYLFLKDFFQKEVVASILKDAKNIFLKQFIKKGYTNIITLDDINDASFNDMIYRLFVDDLECLSNCGKQAQHLISLHSLSISNQVVELLNAVGLTTPVIRTRPVLYFNHPKLAKQKIFYKVDAHQDWRSMQGSLNSVVIWLPLVDVNKQLGALEILPGSHLQGLKTDHINNGFGMVELNTEEKSKLVTVEVKRGDALIFSSFLIHQSGENITDSPRWSCHFRYNDLDDETFKERKYAHAYIYKPVDTLITPDFPSLQEIDKIFSK